jgi:hypothetical protein
MSEIRSQLLEVILKNESQIASDDIIQTNQFRRKQSQILKILVYEIFLGEREIFGTH